MSDIVIKAENISKAYQLGDFGTGTLSRDIERWWTMLRGKEDPFLKIGESNDRAVQGGSDIVWSLKDINFEIQQGDAVGIIGRNGAGKSTLLKLLSRVTTPTTGEISVKGRIASLLEVGTGFHPELTGRENIFLNGAILGMRKAEIRRQFDNIVAFAGVERYIDTPVKRYSSGMYVRLAFAVAAHLESEILIVDEVLAVGDAEFQKKCLGKMSELSKGQGRTVLFVSHNMGTIAQLCQKAILLNKGQLEVYSNTNEVINAYLQQSQSKEVVYTGTQTDKSMYIKSALTRNMADRPTDVFRFDEEIVLDLTLTVKDHNSMAKLSVTLQNGSGDYLSTFVEDISGLMGDLNEAQIKYKLPHSLITPNLYYFRFALFVPNGEVFDLVEHVCPTKIIDSGTNMSLYEGINYGSFTLDYVKI